MEKLLRIRKFFCSASVNDYYGRILSVNFSVSYGEKFFYDTRPSIWHTSTATKFFNVTPTEPTSWSASDVDGLSFDGLETLAASRTIFIKSIGIIKHRDVEEIFVQWFRRRSRGRSQSESSSCRRRRRRRSSNRMIIRPWSLDKSRFLLRRRSLKYLRPIL